MTDSDIKKSADGGPPVSLSGRWRMCEVRVISLENGETIKRGCGRAGLMPDDVGWRCFYCGNYIFRRSPTLSSLWFHFKVGREYWRAMSQGGHNFINGVPVSGFPDSLPSCLRGDLTETRPPKWFKYYIVFDEDQFQKYLEEQGR